MVYDKPTNSWSEFTMTQHMKSWSKYNYLFEIQCHCYFAFNVIQYCNFWKGIKVTAFDYLLFSQPNSLGVAEGEGESGLSEDERPLHIASSTRLHSNC